MGRHLAVKNAEGNDLVSKYVEEHPDKFVGLATVNPWWGEEAVEELRRALKRPGMVGVKLHPAIQGFETNDPIVYPIIEEAVKFNAPVYIHAGTPILAMPYKLADLSDVFPDAKLILGHLGWDYHFDLLGALDKRENIYMETSKQEFVTFRNVYLALGADRMLFGSDYPFNRFEHELAKIHLLEDASDEEKENILYENAAKLFKMNI
jgi:predicted TIM-barrel fold metal-dependent hydrolase